MYNFFKKLDGFIFELFQKNVVEKVVDTMMVQDKRIYLETKCSLSTAQDLEIVNKKSSETFGIEISFSAFRF